MAVLEVEGEGAHVMAGSGNQCDEDTWLSSSDPDFWPYLVAVVVLVVVGGIMSGLQQGLMQIDRPALRSMQEDAKSPLFQWLISFMEPLVKRRHTTLVTLLVSNSLAMESLPIFFDVLVPKYFAILFSVSLLLIFGEIIPQALCLRYPGELASMFAPVVWCLSVVFFPIVYPTARFLDRLLGEKHTRTYTRIGLGELAREQRGQLSSDELDVITGALELYEKVARDISLPMERVFKLSYHQQLNDKVMRLILESGHSRVPVWKNHENNIVGLLLVKHLIRINPEEHVCVFDLQIMPLFQIKENFSLFGLLRAFQTGASHMAVMVEGEEDKAAQSLQQMAKDHGSGSPISSNPKQQEHYSEFSPGRRRTHTRECVGVSMTQVEQDPVKCLGIITLEDVIEQLLKRSIEDETDLWKPANQQLETRLMQMRSLRDDLLCTLQRDHSCRDDLGTFAQIKSEKDSLTGGGDRCSSYGSLNDFEQANGNITSTPTESSALLQMVGEFTSSSSSSSAHQTLCISE